MKRALTAATIYFLALFALGFVLGTIRVTLIAPRVGDFVATAIEFPLMLIAALFICRWVVRRWQVPPAASLRWMMALWLLVLLLVAEALLGLIVFNQTLADQWTALSTQAGLLGLFAQILAASLPSWVGKRKFR